MMLQRSARIEIDYVLADNISTIWRLLSVTFGSSPGLV